MSLEKIIKKLKKALICTGAALMLNYGLAAAAEQFSAKSKSGKVKRFTVYNEYADTCVIVKNESGGLEDKFHLAGRLLKKVGSPDPIGMYDEDSIRIMGKEYFFNKNRDGFYILEGRVPPKLEQEPEKTVETKKQPEENYSNADEDLPFPFEQRVQREIMAAKEKESRKTSKPAMEQEQKQEITDVVKEVQVSTQTARKTVAQIDQELYEKAYEAGLKLYDAEQYDKAIFQFLTAVNRKETKDAIYKLIDCYEKTDNLEQAMQYAKFGSIRFPEEGRMYRLLGFYEKDPKKAIDYYQKAIEIDSDDGGAWQSVGYKKLLSILKKGQS